MTLWLKAVFRLVELLPTHPEVARQVSFDGAQLPNLQRAANGSSGADAGAAGGGGEEAGSVLARVRDRPLGQAAPVWVYAALGLGSVAAVAALVHRCARRFACAGGRLAWQTPGDHPVRWWVCVCAACIKWNGPPPASCRKEGVCPLLCCCDVSQVEQVVAAAARARRGARRFSTLGERKSLSRRRARCAILFTYCGLCRAGGVPRRDCARSSPLWPPLVGLRCELHVYVGVGLAVVLGQDPWRPASAGGVYAVA